MIEGDRLGYELLQIGARQFVVGVKQVVGDPVDPIALPFVADAQQGAHLDQQPPLGLEMFADLDQVEVRYFYFVAA